MPREAKPPRPGPLRVFHLLMHVGKLLEDRCREQLEAYGLHHGQARVLMTLHRRGGQLQADLARGMDIAPPTLSVMLRKLLEQGLVERETVKGDERVYRIKLTKLGVKAVDSIQRVWSEADEVIVGAIDEADVGGLHDELLKIRDALGGRSPKL